MKPTKIEYTKTATTFEQQIDILKHRGVIITDEKKAKEYLSDIGYYHLGFYFHPFEISYPELESKRKHHLRQDTRIEDVVALYYFDFDLRNIINRYVSRIEISIRTTMIYRLSNKYHADPTWFVNPQVVSSDFISKFPTQAYLSIKKKGPIKRHHTKYIGGYAPAWKSIEYMTLGNLEILYDSLLLDSDKRMISLHYGEPAIGTFKSYLTTIREVRNICAHGSFLFGMKLTKGIRSGMACRTFPNQSQQSFQGALYVIDYLLKTVSKNRTRDMWNDIFVITKRLYSKAPMTQTIIEKLTGIILPENFTENESFANTFRD